MIIITILIFIVALSLPSLKTRISPTFFLRISSLSFIYAAILAFNVLYIKSIGKGVGIYSGLFLISSFSQSFDLLILISGAIIFIAWPIIYKSIDYLSLKIVNIDNYSSYNLYATEYSLIALFSTLGSILLVSSADLISMYLSIELQSFGLYILATLYREYKLATSAGLKYFLLGGLSSCLLLLGSVIIYTFSGNTSLDGIFSFISVYTNNNINTGITLGFIIIIISFLFKIAAAPLHNWAPDVYSDSPTIITIWLTIMPKIAILIFLLDLQIQIGIVEQSYSSLLKINNSSILEPFFSINISNTLFILSSLMCLIIGSIVGLNQIKIKRLLAYSTISHIGFMLLSLTINSQQSIESFLFYLIQYTLTNLNTFLIIIAFGYIIHISAQFYNISNYLDYIKNSKLSNKISNSINKKSTENYKPELQLPSTDIATLSEFTGQFYTYPLLTISFTICLFSMAGI